MEFSMSSKPFGGVSEQSRAGIHRRADAQALFEKGRWRGAMYLAGYALECRLKSGLMQKYKCRDLDELEVQLKSRGLISGDATVYDHRLELYLKAAGALVRLRDNPSPWRRFNVVNRWLPSWRYNPDLSNAEDAQDFLAAVDDILHWIDGNL